MSAKTSALELINFLNEEGKDKIENSVNKLKNIVNIFFRGDSKLSVDLNRFLPNSFVNTEFIKEFIMFLKYVANCSLKEEYDKLKDKFQIKDCSNIDLYLETISSVITNKNISSNELISFDWQLALIEKQSSNSNMELSKYDKIDINFNFKLNSLEEKDTDGDFNLQRNNKITDNVLKFNYYEFQEVLEDRKSVV